MIAGVLPLIFVTMFLSWWLNQGYDKIVDHLPMEEMGEVIRDVQDSAPLPSVTGTSPESTQATLAATKQPHVVASPKATPETVPKPLRSDSLRGKMMSTFSRFGSTAGTELRLASRPVRLAAGNGIVGSPVVAEPPSTLVDIEAAPPRIDGDAVRPRQSFLSFASSANQMDSMFDEANMVDQEPLSDEDDAAALTSRDVAGPHEEQTRNTGAAPPVPTGGQRRRHARFLESFRISSPSISSSTAAQHWSDANEDATHTEPNDAEDHRAPLLRRSHTTSSQTRNVVVMSFEPPSTRVPGILDAQIEPSPLLAGAMVAMAEEEEDDDDELSAARQQGSSSRRPSGAPSNADPDTIRHATVITLDGDGVPDLQSETYLHPALIGRLPVAWIPGATQPERLAEAREDQVRAQRALIRRIIGLQRAGVAEVEGRRAEAAAAAAAAAAASDTNGAWMADDDADTEAAAIRRYGLVAWAANFVDSVTSWAHMETAFL
ncbi:hypothetical protein HK405_002662 [Cladochytrium tenue]|nr:hypothetical protein HK405_002662 [Cladochytrium tenue]